jgi:hypothetical protein
MLWLVKKMTMGQDSILLGYPGDTSERIIKRSYACSRSSSKEIAFPQNKIFFFFFFFFFFLIFKIPLRCFLLRRPLERVVITRDTTEADLKQRRELRSKTSTFADGPAVVAALQGKILWIDGVEKAERNVLPLLNNLMENREMALEDGRFLMAPGRLEAMGKESEGRMLSVHKDFMVVATALPVPMFPGFTLDPPLRYETNRKSFYLDFHRGFFFFFFLSRTRQISAPGAFCART